MTRGGVVAFGAFLGLMAYAPIVSGQETNPVQTKIGVNEAWMGQRIPLFITLTSPGPFSGTAVFQLPQLPQTVIVRQGNPVVGSDTIAGESVMTQRHEFHVYTQQSGAVEIPAIPVTFESKNSFIGDAQPRSGSTTPVTLESKRPPGTEAFPFVVTSSSLTVAQSWSSELESEIEAGDILSRTITREANDISVMFLEPLTAGTIDGVRLYLTEPDVTDRRERGVTAAIRTDTIKYQFERGGVFFIPELSFKWWNPSKETIEQTTLEGTTVAVRGRSIAAQPADNRKLFLSVVGGLMVLGIAIWLLGPIVKNQYRGWYDRRHTPVLKAARELMRACRRNDSQSAFVALMDWKRAMRLGAELPGSIRAPAETLTQHLFAGGNAKAAWNGESLLVGFREVFKQNKLSQTRRSTEVLPPLNPC